MIDNQIFEIYSIGHGNRSMDDFLLLLHNSNIDIVADVRTIPYSRFHPQFRQLNLKNSLIKGGIEYLHLIVLGGRPVNIALYTNGKLDYQLVKAEVEFQNEIVRVMDLVKSGIKVALMCSESDPNDCHRKHLLANEFARQGINVWHINKTGDLEKHQKANPSLFD